MSWKFIKLFKSIPIRTSVSKKGVGSSIGISGFRVGVSPDRCRYFSVGIPGNGISYIKYL